MSETQQTRNELILRSPKKQECFEAVSVESLDETASVQVSLLRSPSEVMAIWLDEFGELPASVTVMCASEREGPKPDVLSNNRVKTTVVNPGDLTGMSIFLRRAFEEVPDSMTTVMCFEGIEIMLEYTDTDKVHRFLDEVCAMSEELGVASHFHLDPEGVEYEKVTDFESIFDGTAES